MKSKTTKVRRYLAAILTVLMIFQQATTSVIYASSEAAVPTVTEAPAAQTEETPEKQVEETPEEKTPTEEENEGEESAAPTEALAENEAEPEVTVTPAAEPTATEAPAVEATATPVPEATPTEVPTAASFTTADGIASVNLTQPIPANAKFVATAQDADSDYFYNNVDAAMGAWVESNGLSVVEATAYDMHFEADGQELAVNQSATVHINFPAAILTRKPETGIQTTYYVLHIKNGTAVPAGTVNGDANGAYSADITTDGFSPFVFVKAAKAENSMNLAAESGANANEYITNLDITANTTPLDRDTGTIEGRFDFSIPNTEKSCSSVYFNIPIEYLVLSGADSGKVRDENGAEIGTYILDQSTGTVTMNFDENYYKNHSNIKGFFHFSGKVNKDALTDKNEIEIKFNAQKSVTFQVKPGTISGYKNGNFVQDENGDLFVDFDICVTPDCTLSDFSLTDQLGGNLEYVADSFVWKDGYDGQPKAIQPTIDNNKFTYNLSKIETGTHILSYRAKVIDKTSDKSLKNTANWSWKGGAAEKPVTWEKSVTKEVTLNKAGTDFSGNTAKWTVSINRADVTAKNEMTNGEYNDILPSGMRLDQTSLKIKDNQNDRDLVLGTDYTLTVTAEGFKINFKDNGAQKVPSYTITYDTVLTGNNLPVNGTKYQNTGSFTPKDGNTVQNQGTSTYKADNLSVSKKVSNIQYQENGDALSDWTITINPNGETLNNIVVWDTFDPGNNGSGKHTGVLKTSIEVKKENGEAVPYQIVQGNDTQELEKDSSYYQKFKLQIEGTVSEKIFLTYSARTFADVVKGSLTEIANGAGVSDGQNYKTASDKFTFEKSTGAMTKSGTVEGEFFKWTVRANIDPVANQNAAKQYGNNDTLTITDIIPEGMSLVTDKGHEPRYILGWDQTYSNALEFNTYSYDSESRKFVARFNGFGKQFLNLIYYTKIDSNYNLSGDAVFTNQVSYSDNGKWMDTASYTITTKGKDLNKTSAESTTDNIITYTVDVNPNQKTFNDGQDLEVTDIIPNGCSYVPKSMKIVEGEDAIVSREYKNGTLILKIKDASHVKFTYELNVLGNIGEKVEVVNTVTLSGKHPVSSSDDKIVTITKTTAGATGEKGIFSITKIDSKTETKLPGATFILQKMKYENGKFSEDGAPFKQTTDENGIARFGEAFKNNQADSGSILYDNLYYWQEIKAPEGYSLSDTEKNTKHYFYIGGNSLSKFQEQLKEAGVNAEQVQYGNYIVSNTPNEKKAVATIQVKKVVKGENAPAEEFTFTLAAKDKAPMPKNATVKVNAGETKNFGEIEYTKAGTYNYTVKETKGNTAGMTYDETSYEIVVTVDQDLKASVDYGTAGATVLTITNSYVDKTVKISKVDATNQKELEGAHIQVIDKDGKIVDEWKSAKEPHVVNNLKPGEIYTLRETVAPDGYTVTSDTTFALKEDGTVDQDKTKTTATVSDKGVVLVEDNMTSVSISKVDITSQKELAGAHIQILDKDGMIVEEWDSTDKAYTIKGLKTGETYTLRETVAPNGYYRKADTTFTLKADGSIDKENTTTTIFKEGILLVEDTAIPTPDVPSGPTAKISKVDVTSQQELEGAKLQVIDKNGNVVDEWISGKTAHVTTELKAGETYTLRETVAPDGYTVTSDTTFTLKEDGTVDQTKTTATVSDKGVVLVEDNMTSVSISKVDITSQKELAGAHIQILDKDGKVVEEWDSTDKAYTIKGLKTGETYTLHETVAPNGYYLKADTTFTLKADGSFDTDNTTTTISSNGVLLVEDTQKTVKTQVSKVDAKTYEVLGGAHLQVIDPDGKVVAEWDSDKDAYTLTDLKPGVVYTLHETAAPKGYKVAEDTTFQLNEDGTIDTANTTTAISDDTLLVKDEKKESKDVSVSVTKKLVTVDGTVIGAMDATYYVALYSDADCTQRVSDVLALNFKNASSSTVTFTGLEKGQTYYVGECEADGTCYLANICADGTMYMVDFSDGNAVTVDNADGSTTVYFDNQFENIPDGYYKEAELNITKKLVGSDGKAKNSNEIFYAGIFADEGFTQLSTDVSANIVPLDLTGGSEATAQVNVALPESGSITLYVTEVDSNGKPVAGAASFKYDVTVDNTQVTLNDDNLSANVVITNKENSTKVTPTPGTPNTPNTTGGFSGKSAVRTGDSTPIGGFIALFAAAAVIAGVAVFFKRRRKDEK